MRSADANNQRSTNAVEARFHAAVLAQICLCKRLFIQRAVHTTNERKTPMYVISSSSRKRYLTCPDLSPHQHEARASAPRARASAKTYTSLLAIVSPSRPSSVYVPCADNSDARPAREQQARRHRTICSSTYKHLRHHRPLSHDIAFAVRHHSAGAMPRPPHTSADPPARWQ